MAMGLKLYELTDAYRRLSEIEDEDFAPALTQIQGAIEEKAAGMMALVRELDTEADALKLEAKRLAERGAARTNRAQRIKDYLRQEMEAAGLLKIKTPYFTANVVKSPPACKMLDQEAIPSEYLESVTTWKVLAKKIIEAWKETGEAVPGVEIIEATHLRIT